MFNFVNTKYLWNTVLKSMKYVFLLWSNKLAVSLSITCQILSGIIGAVFT